MTEEEKVIKYIEQKEEKALEIYRKSGGKSYPLLPASLREVLDDAFLAGYAYGGIEHDADLRRVQRESPKDFQAWIDDI